MQKFLTSFLLIVSTVAQGQSLSLADTLKSTTTTEAVSYTHLDVYKRQGRGRLMPGCRAGLRRALAVPI